MEDSNHFFAHPDGGVTTTPPDAKPKVQDVIPPLTPEEQAAADAEAKAKADADAAQAQADADAKAKAQADAEAAAETAGTAAVEARKIADELKAALTDESTDEEKAAAQTGEEAAVAAETIANEAKANAGIGL